MPLFGKNTVNLQVKINWRFRLTIMKIRIFSWFKPSKAMYLFGKMIEEINEDVLKFVTIKEVKS
jgi:hypothetical protein